MSAPQGPDTPSPLEGEEESVEEKRAERTARDHALWEHWNTNGRQPEHLEPLLNAFEPVFAQKTKEWNAPSIPSSAFHGELMKHAIRAFESYDPNRGASLSTWVHGNLRQAHRFREQAQNLAYIPYGKSQHIGDVDRGVDALTTELGREPSVEELSNHLGMPVSQLLGVQRARRRDLPGSAWESDPHGQAASRDREVLDALPEILSEDERLVFNHTYGREGAKQLSETNEIARALGKSPSWVSRRRTSIDAKFRRFR